MKHENHSIGYSQIVKLKEKEGKNKRKAKEKVRRKSCSAFGEKEMIIHWKYQQVE